jgi:hypothetical protein
MSNSNSHGASKTHMGLGTKAIAVVPPGHCGVRGGVGARVAWRLHVLISESTMYLEPPGLFVGLALLASRGGGRRRAAACGI